MHKFVLVQDAKVSECSEVQIEGENKDRTDRVELFGSIGMCGHGRWQLVMSLFIFVTFKELYPLKTAELSGGNEVIVSKESHRLMCIWILP